MGYSPSDSLSVGFTQQEFCSRLPFPFPGHLPTWGSNQSLLHWQAESLPLSHQESPHFPCCMCAKSLPICLTLWTPGTVARQASPSMGFSRQEYWSGLPLPSPGDLPNPGIEPISLMSPALVAAAAKSLQSCLTLCNRFFTISSTWEALGALKKKETELPVVKDYLVLTYLFSLVQFSCSVVADSLRPHELQHARPPCPSPTPGVHSDSRPSSP